MGANLVTRTYLTEDRAEIVKKFKEACEQSRIEDGCSYSGCIGMFHGISKWFGSPCTDQDAADEFIADKHQKYDGAFAVAFYYQDADKKQKIGYLVGGWVSS